MTCVNELIISAIHKMNKWHVRPHEICHLQKKELTKIILSVMDYANLQTLTNITVQAIIEINEKKLPL